MSALSRETGTLPLKIYDFGGGIHPPENKSQSTQQPIANPPLPGKIILPMKQHTGAAAEPIVAVGDKVLKGQMVAEPFGRVSAAVHAPTSGKVIAIAQHAVPHPSGMADLCIHIEPDGLDEWTQRIPLTDYLNESRETVLSFLRNAGIAGLGGAGFPTDIKLTTPDSNPIDTLILNGAECEPYITADDMLMRERADEVLRGGEILAWLLGKPRIIVGIEDNKPQAIAALKEAAMRSIYPVEVAVVPTKYPSGGAKQLTYLLTGREVPSAGRSHEIGVICVNVGTSAAIFRAVTLGEPLISRVTTLTGQALSTPQNVEALIGTPVEFLLNFAGVDSKQLNKLIMGGPMMGFPLQEYSTPVTKLTNCLIASTPAEMPATPPSQACIRCGLCEQACPEYLLPQQLYWFARSQEYDKAEQFNLFDCIECGACAYVCPSSIPLVQYYRNAKDEIRQEAAEHQKAEHARIRFEARQARLQREIDEKEAKRKARAEEAAKAQAAKAAGVAVAPSATASATPAVAADDIKTLKTAAAIARTKVKKAEKALAAAQESGDETQALEQELNILQQASADAETALQKAEQSAAPAANANAGVDVKALKVAAAIARTKAKKAEKALVAATENGDANLSQLESEYQQLAKAAEEADHALTEAEKAHAPVPAAVDTKQLKIDAAIARTKAKKAEKALVAAREAGEETTLLQQEFDQLSKVSLEADHALQAAEKSASTSESSAGQDLKALKTAAAVARTKLKKAEQALQTAEAKGMDGESVDTLRSTVMDLQAKSATAEQALSAAESEASTATASAESTPAQPADLKKLKIDAAMAKAAAKKAERAHEQVQQDGGDTTASLAALESARAQAEQAQAALNAAQS
ncbi:electron transport complex subunit RsxC [Pokkaliibacter sp. CJK22405]|uniref:electron transport complex subunit RsxC n=1 Tax=Pokkaliibacter sp. CJK22405 TaxID=3384615 RepID=UPI00398479B8